MSRWVCPECRREFGRTRQSHECAPAMTLDDYFSTGHPREREVFDAVIGFLRTLGPMYVEPVSVGIFIKADRSFVELRPKVKWVACSFPFPRRIEHPRIARRMPASRTSATLYHVVNLTGADDLDDPVRDWLAESYRFVIER